MTANFNSNVVFVTSPWNSGALNMLHYSTQSSFISKFLYLCSIHSEWITVLLIGQDRSPQPPGKKHNSGFGLPPIAVTKNKNKKKTMSFINAFFKHDQFKNITNVLLKRLRYRSSAAASPKCYFIWIESILNFSNCSAAKEIILKWLRLPMQRKL